MEQATSSKTEATPKFLDKLSPEILALILEQLYNIDEPSLWTARRACRRISILATPILYRNLELNEALVRVDAGVRYPRLFEHVQCYTTTLIVRSDLNRAGVRELVSQAERLSLLRWRYVNAEDSVSRGGHCMPVDLLDLDRLTGHAVKLDIENLPLNGGNAQETDSYLRDIPAHLLVSLKISHTFPPLNHRLMPLKALLSEARELQTFHYEARGQGTSFLFDGDERMPAISDLRLRSYDWSHDRQAVSKHWNFSKLRSLQLISLPTYNFLASINPVDLRRIRTLRVEDFSAHLPDRRREATVALSNIIGSHIDSLETLDVVCHLPLLSLSSILQHGRSLRFLKIRDHTGFGEDTQDQSCPTYSECDVARLAGHLTSLRTLELDMDITQCDPTSFLRAVCRFSNLHTLVLHVQTLISPFEAVQSGTDRDFDAAMHTFRCLIRERDLSFPHKPWGRIVINVGEWRRVMVRRVGAAWRERNEMGIFAERCFVLEKNAHGQFGVTEELSMESSPSRLPTPEL